MVKKAPAVNESAIGLIGKGAGAQTNYIRISVVTKDDKKEILKQISWTQRKTLNRLINDILDEYIEEHQADVEEYHREYPRINKRKGVK